MEYARLVLRRQLADRTDVKAIPTLEGQYLLTETASQITNAPAADSKIERALSSSAILENKEDWTMASLFEVDAMKWAKIKRRLRSIQESCLVKRQRVPENVLEVVDLAVKPVSTRQCRRPRRSVLLIRVLMS